MGDNARVLSTDAGDGIRLITFNRPTARNAIDMAMGERLSALIDEAAADAAARVLVLTGAGDAAFSAGFDIREMAAFDAAAMRVAFLRRDPLMLRIAQCPIPVIAALNGLAHGAGALIAAACDFRIACPATDFRVTAINYGSANATWSLSRIVGTARAKDIIMTGRRVGADEGLRIGLFDRLAPDAGALDAALDLARELAGKPAAAIRAAKRLIDRSPELSLADAWAAEHHHVLSSLEAGDQGGRDVFSGFLAKRRGQAPKT